MRTTLDIETPILREVRRVAERQGRAMGAVVSELLADALSRRSRTAAPAPLAWTSGRMGARVDLEDKDAVHAILDEDGS